MTWHTFLRIVEFRTKILSFSSLILALLAAVWILGPVSWYQAVLVFVTVLAVDLGTNALQTFLDHEKGIRHEPGRRTAPGHALVTALGLFAFAGVLGLFLVIWTGWPLLVIGALSFGAAFLTADGVRHPGVSRWVEAVGAVFLGTVLWVVLFDVLSAPDRWTADLWWRVPLLSLPSVLSVAAVLVTGRCASREGSPAAGRLAGAQVLLLPLAAYGTQALLGAFGLVPWTMMIAALAGPAASVPAWRALYRHGFRPETKDLVLGQALTVFGIFTLVTVAGWAAGIALR